MTLILNGSFHVSRRALRQSFTLLLGDIMSLLLETSQAVQLCVTALIKFHRFSLGFRSGGRLAILIFIFYSVICLYLGVRCWFIVLSVVNLFSFCHMMNKVLSNLIWWSFIHTFLDLAVAMEHCPAGKITKLQYICPSSHVSLQ